MRANFFEYTDSDGDKFISLLPEYDYNQIFCPRNKFALFFCQPTIWSALYERNFLNEYGISFLESPGASYQDVGFNFKVWAMAQRVWLTPNAYYHYRCDHLGSSVKSQDKIFCVVDEWKEVERYVAQYPGLSEDSYILRNHVKLGNYMWNYRRLFGDAQQAFREIFSREYREALSNNGLCKDSMPSKDWMTLMKIILPSWQYIYEMFKSKLSRLFVKTKNRNGKIHTSILFGLIRREKANSVLCWRNTI